MDIKGTVDKVLGAVEDFFTVNEGTITYTGKVVYAFPWLNLYVIEPVRDGSVTTALRMASGPDPVSRGSSTIQTFSVGSFVTVYADKECHGNLSLTDYIIGNASVPNNDIEDNTDISRRYTMAPVAGIRSILDRVFNSVRSICGILDINTPKSFNTPQDMLSGDTVVASSPDTGVMALKHLVRIQCGKGCYVELDSVLSRIRVVTASMEYIGPLKHNQDMSGNGSLLDYSKTAISRKEGTRGIDNDSGLQPMFRKIDISGDMTSGWQTSVTVPSDTDNTTTDVYSSRVRYDGAATLVSAKGFELKKSLGIITPYQKQDFDELTSKINEVVEFPNLTNNPSKYDGDTLMHRSLTHWDEYNTSKDSDFPRTTVNTDTWDLSSNNTPKSVSDALEQEQNRSIDPLGDKQYYDLPDTITIKDPHTGNNYTYFKSTSGLRQDPDGSMTIYDGYGSEIRMVRGNIIISAAADIVLRPGRDLHTMSGRHTAIVSQDDVSIHSSNKDVYIKGDRDVNILAGIDKDGGILLDDRGSRGTVIRSKVNASLVAQDIFVGSIPEDTPDILTGASQGSGTVVIGGGAQTLVTGSSVITSGNSIDSIARDGSSVSWVSMDSNRIISISKNTHMSGEVYVGQISGALTASIGNSVIVAGNQSSKSTLKVLSTLDVAHGIRCRQVWADQAMFVEAGIGNADRSTGLRAHVPAPSITIDVPVIDQESVIDVRYKGPWLDSLNLGVSFKYPSSKDLNISNTYSIPGILWQTYLKDGKVWNEHEIPDIRSKMEGSMVYPGKAAWDGVMDYGHGENKSINGGYIING